MRPLVALVAVCPVAFSRFAWFDQALSSSRSQDKDTLDDLFSDLLGDINLDISFNAPQTTISSEIDATAVDEVEEAAVTTDPEDPMNWSSVMNANDLFIDESPASMFSSFGPFGGLFDRVRSMSPLFGSGLSDFTQYSSPSTRAKPLFLMVQSLRDGHDLSDVMESQMNDIPMMESEPMSSLVFRLQHSNQVNGNTVRYTMQSAGDGSQFMTQSWSTPNAPKMYLCNSESCDSDNGMEMMDVFEDLMGGLGQRPRSYFHLVPTTTSNRMQMDDIWPIELELEGEGEEGEMEGDDYGMWNWMDYAMDKARGCHQKMQGLKDWYFGDNVEVMPYSTFSTTKAVEFIIEVDGHWDEAEGVDEQMDEQTLAEDAYFGIATMLMMMATACGLVYSVYQFRKTAMARKRYNPSDYISMHETDQFQTRGE